MFLCRFTELSVEPEKPRFLWDRDSARSAKRVRWVTRCALTQPTNCTFTYAVARFVYVNGEHWHGDFVAVRRVCCPPPPSSVGGQQATRAATPISCGVYRVRLGAPLIKNKYFRDGAPRCALWRCFQRHALSKTLCGWRYA